MSSLHKKLLHLQVLISLSKPTFVQSLLLVLNQGMIMDKDKDTICSSEHQRLHIQGRKSNALTSEDLIYILVLSNNRSPTFLFEKYNNSYLQDYDKN